jgi:cysteinyl-tRNA synthetase
MNPPEASQDAQIEMRLAEREAARQRKDWSAADHIRDELEAAGIEVIDTPAGPRWRRR